MILKNLYCCLLSCCILVCFSCKKQVYISPVILDAQRLVYDYPDSARVLLESYCEPTVKRVTKISNRYERAKYALLYSQALQEKGFNIGSDSLLRIAVNFFVSKDSLLLERGMAFYYRGKIFENKGRVEDAISSYLDAAACLDGVRNKRVMDKVSFVPKKEFYLSGRVYGALGKMLHEQYSFGEALKYYKLSAQGYKESGELRRLMLMTEGVAITYFLTDNFQGALGNYNKALKYAEQLRDTSKIISLNRGLVAIILQMTGDVKLAKSMLVEVNEKYNYLFGDDDYPLFASLYLKEGNMAKASFFINKSLEKKDGYTQHQKVGMYALAGRIEARRGNLDKAYEYSTKGVAISDSLSKRDKNDFVVEIIQRNKQERLALAKESQRREYRYISVIYVLAIIISGILLIAAIMVVIIHKRELKKRNFRIEVYLQQLNKMEETRNNIIARLDSQIENEAMLKELLQTRFAEVRELARTYYEYGYSKNLQKKVEDILSVQLLQGESFETIEKIINAGKNGAIEKIRDKYPTIKEESIKLLCLIYAGFSPQEICAVLNDVPQNIYVKKYRLKNKLADFIATNPEADFK